MTENANKALARFPTIDGMLGRLDACVMVALLAHQEAAGIKGALAEFGVYKGRSAMLLATFARPGEELYLVDVAASYLDREKIAEVFPSYKFIQSDSGEFIKVALGNKPSRTFRFCHSDGSHTFDNVARDLKVAEQILSDDGILVFDDYYNPHYPQVAAALFTYLAQNQTTLRVFLVGSNKCYLCRASRHETMMKFTCNEFPRLMTSYDCPIQLSKTDVNPHFDAYSFKGRKVGSSDDELYGTHLYKHFYKR